MITTVGVFARQEDASETLEELRTLGIGGSDVSCVYTNSEGKMRDAQAPEKVIESLAKGAVTGAVIGGIAGVVVTSGIVPGVGMLFAASPLASLLRLTGTAAVAGIATGAIAGGLIGAFTGFGIAKEDVEYYEHRIRKGDIIVIARLTPEHAKEIFIKHGAASVVQYKNAAI